MASNGFDITITKALGACCLIFFATSFIIPKLISNMSENRGDFRKLSYLEAIFVVILFNNLFNR